MRAPLAFHPPCVASHDVLHDLGMSDSEIATYFLHFGSVRVILVDDDPDAQRFDPHLLKLVASLNSASAIPAIHL